MTDLVRLRAGDLALAIAPSVGGAIVAFAKGDLPLLRETPRGAVEAGEVRRACSYPLIPYSNRIAGGRFSFAGEEHRLALNFGDHPHAIHGNAWQGAFAVDRADASSSVLSFAHDATGDGARAWPFAYRAEQRFRLDPNGLTLTLAIENRDRRAFPAGMGLHPFFVRRPGTTLRFRAGSVWLNGADALPSERVRVPDAWDFAEARPVGVAVLDNCFAGWDGLAEIRHENEAIAITVRADPIFGHLVVFVPEGRSDFAVEPVSNMNDAVNRMGSVPDHGLALLSPGERLEGTVRFTVERLP